MAAAVGFVLLQVFGERGYCWRNPDATAGMRNGHRNCWEVGASAADAVLSLLGAVLVLGAGLAVIGALVWLFRPSARGG